MRRKAEKLDMWVTKAKDSLSRQNTLKSEDLNELFDDTEKNLEREYRECYDSLKPYLEQIDCGSQLESEFTTLTRMYQVLFSFFSCSNQNVFNVDGPKG